MEDEKRPSAGPTPSPIVQRVPHRVVVFSGKGGVGKTTVAVNLAYALMATGLHVGLLDADVTGPNVALMTGIRDRPQASKGQLTPHEQRGLRVVSLASLLPADAPVIWRGPMRSKAIEQLLDDTAWGSLDLLIMDLPPGTGDEVLTIAQRTLPQIAVVVTTPQEVALLDARRAIGFAKKLSIPVVGVVENMSGLVCPHCGDSIALFGRGGGELEARRHGIPFFGAIPIDPSAREAGDEGRPVVLDQPESPVSKAFASIAEAVRTRLKDTESA